MVAPTPSHSPQTTAKPCIGGATNTLYIKLSRRELRFEILQLY
jgi:hypothetical protein